jgi:hypothetical protein
VLGPFDLKVFGYLFVENEPFTGDKESFLEGDVLIIGNSKTESSLSFKYAFIFKIFAFFISKKYKAFIALFESYFEEKGPYRH